MKTEAEIIQDALNGLKDFQKKSVEYIYKQFYENGKKRVLIADEVGLGKTIIAKGLIAKAYQEKKKLNVVYICSNQALARQNINKLNLFNTKKPPYGRLTYLALDAYDSEEKFQINTLTPSTSFNVKKSTGQAKERVIIFSLLTNYDVFNKKRKRKLSILLKGTSIYKNWQDRIKKFDKNSLVDKLESEFRAKLLKESFTKEKYPLSYEFLGTTREIFLWEALRLITDKITSSSKQTFNFSIELISALRTILSKITLKKLKADLFILDEFQRFKDLIDIDNKSDAGIIAREIFKIDNTKVLMLSATPFKPYTNKFDSLEGENHYKELIKIMQFLQEKEGANYWQKFEKDRKAFFDLLKNPKETIQNLEEAKKIKLNLENHYKAVISRNERASVTSDGKTMVKEIKNFIKILPEDIEDYIYIDSLANKLNEQIEQNRYKINNQIEFSKSVPFPLSFSDNYKINREIKKAYKNNKFTVPNKGFLNTKVINNYKPILSKTNSIYPNAKMRDLLETTFKDKAYNLLWIPPSLPYYKPFAAFKNNQDYSKNLIFSSWAMVPRAIATIVSYEAERLTVGAENTSKLNEKKKRTYFLKQRLPRPLLTFTAKENEGNRMYNYCLLYPSRSLTTIIETKEFLTFKTHTELKKVIKNRLKDQLNTLEKKHKTHNTIEDRWYWLAPLLLDKENFNTNELELWLQQKIKGSSIIEDPENKEEKKLKRSNKAKDIHNKELYNTFMNPEDFKLGKFPKDLLNVMAEMVISSPAITALRTIMNLYPKENIQNKLEAASLISEGFFALFNKPESISIIRSHTVQDGNKGYWHNTLQYAISGNIQAMLDEYCYMLYDNGGFKEKMLDLGKQIKAVMAIRSSPISIETKDSIKIEHTKDSTTNKKKSLRTHFALSFGTQKVESESGENRMVNILDAFNSPFRPFVLASTSLGQEGLDFHYYCRKITHWNLPTNAIDLEQREGRVNRYKGLVIRKNIIKNYSNFTFKENNVWEEVFSEAEKDTQETALNDMIPFWHLNYEDRIEIERNVPLLPFSKDINKYKNLIKVLAVYRLTFGQPRQEELVETLKSELTAEEIEIIRKNLTINLSPE